jgi:hypothetical protein
MPAGHSFSSISASCLTKIVRKRHSACKASILGGATILVGSTTYDICSVTGRIKNCLARHAGSHVMMDTARSGTA